MSTETAYSPWRELYWGPFRGMSASCGKAVAEEGRVPDRAELAIEPGYSSLNDAGQEKSSSPCKAGGILLYLDIQKHGGIFSPGGCAVVAGNLCPHPRQIPRMGQ